MIFMPSATLAELKTLFPAVLAAAEPIFAQSRNMIVEIGINGAISSCRLPR